MMKKSLYIFRHGETDYNKENRTMGWLDVPLNHTGVIQAKELASILKSIELDIIYSSPLSRALETAKIVAEATGVNIVMNDDLREQNCGVLQGHIVRLTSNPEECEFDLSQDQIMLLAKELKNPDFVPEGGESQNDLMLRSINIIIEIARNSEYEKIGISTHGGVARSIISKFTDKKSVGGMPNAAYFKLDWDGEKLLLNDIPEWLTSKDGE